MPVDIYSLDPQYYEMSIKKLLTDTGLTDICLDLCEEKLYFTATGE